MKHAKRVVYSHNALHVTSDFMSFQPVGNVINVTHCVMIAIRVKHASVLTDVSLDRDRQSRETVTLIQTNVFLVVNLEISLGLTITHATNAKMIFTVLSVIYNALRIVNQRYVIEMAVTVMHVVMGSMATTATRHVQ